MVSPANPALNGTIGGAVSSLLMPPKIISHVDVLFTDNIFYGNVQNYIARNLIG
jgi:hypothetical protein